MTTTFTPRRIPWPLAALIVGATALTAVLGGLASVNAASFYAQLAKPSWAPPAGVFGPVWTLLFLMMAAAAVLAARARGLDAVTTALRIYAMQLVLNALWSWLFFRWHHGAAAFVDTLLLATTVALCARGFWRLRPLAGALMLPYLAWVAFATGLTWSVWQLNPGML